MAKVETKDRQEQQSGSPRQDGSPFDTGMIERELDDLLRQRKLARQGRGLEELLGETHGEEGRDGPEEPDEAKPRQQQAAGDVFGAKPCRRTWGCVPLRTPERVAPPGRSAAAPKPMYCSGYPTVKLWAQRTKTLGPTI